MAAKTARFAVRLTAEQIAAKKPRLEKLCAETAIFNAPE
jgi:hypothetical protein